MGLVSRDLFSPESRVLDHFKIIGDLDLTSEAKRGVFVVGRKIKTPLFAFVFFSHLARTYLYGAGTTGAEALAVEPLGIAIMWGEAGTE